MATKTITVPVLDDHAEPAWEVALLFPAQGEWSEDDYLWLTDHTRCLVEFTERHIEVLPMPTEAHQLLVLFLYRALYAFLGAQGSGIVLVAPFRLRLRTGRYREPDLLLLLSTNDARRSNQFWTGADLVLEVLSPVDPHRDLVRKRQEYAQAEIPEYWLIDPATEQIIVLRLEGTTYVEHGVSLQRCVCISPLSPLFSLQPAAHHPPPVCRAGRLAGRAGALGALQVAGSGRQGGRSRRWKSPFDFPIRIRTLYL